MKYPLIGLSLLVATPLSAGAYSESSRHGTEEECSSCDPCCDPCCKPKKCIDCECYTPAYYDLQCDWGFSFSADFLYWYARETNVEYAVERTVAVFLDPFDERGLDKKIKSKNFQTNWKPGVRIGVGYNSSCDGWDTAFNWTYMRNKRTDSASGSESEIDTYRVNTSGDPPSGDRFLLENPWNFLNISVINDFDAVGTSIPIYGWTKISASWTMKLNQFDWELGRKYWLSPCFSFRPFTGVRGAWITSNISVDGATRIPYSDFEGMETFTDSISSKTKSNNCSWGAGFLVGIQPSWHFCSNFILYSSLNTALLWGEFKSKVDQTLISTAVETGGQVELPFSQENRFYEMQAVIDMGIGLRWEENWCCDRYRTAVDIGWEHHIWFDYNHRPTTNNQSLFASDRFSKQTLYERTGNLMMGGLVVRVRFDF